MNQPSTKPNNTSNPNPNPNSNARAPPALAAAAAECGNCGSQKRWVLHHVRIRGIHRRLCTSCVLRLHPSSFCPSCFQCYDTTNTPVSSKRLTCSKCSSFTHSHCASPPPPSSSSTTTNTTPSSSTYLCPPCTTPNFTFFDLDSDSNKAIDKRVALVLLCASKIASTSMAKAVIVARAEAERRVREAALARKRAREALDHLALLVHSRGDKVVRKDVAEVSAEVSGSANLVHKHKEKEKEKNPPLLPNSQGKEMFNGFNSSRQNPAMKPSGSPPNKKSTNGEPEHGCANQSNGNVNDKEKSGGLVNRESMALEQKNHGRGENVPAAK